MKTPTLSVVIPTYNDSKVLSKCLEHLNAVNFEDSFEVIVVDDGSTDSTAELLEDWKKKAKTFELKFLRQENRGAASARNEGVQVSSGEVIIFIGADILVSELWLKEHAQFHKEHANAVAVGFMTWSPELGKDRFRRFLESSGIALSFKGLKNLEKTDFWHFFTGNISMRKSLFQQFKFDEAFKAYGFEDIMLGYEMSKAGIEIFFLEKALAYHHHELTEKDYFPGRMMKIGESAVLFEEKFPNCRVLPKGLKLYIFKMLAFFAPILLLLKKEWGWYAFSKKYFLRGVRQAKKKPTCLIIGSYGAGNIGDEAILEVMLKEMSESWTISVLSGDIKDTKTRHKVPVASHFPFGLRSFFTSNWIKSFWFLWNSSCVVMGGGGLFTDTYSKKAVYLWSWHVLLAKLFGKPVYLFANSFGPIEGTLEKKLVQWVFKYFDKISLRDERSRAELLSLGFESKLCFDPVILLNAPEKTSSKKKIALNLRPTKNQLDMAPFIQELKKEGYEISFVAMEKMDTALLSQYGAVFQPKDIKELIHFLSECEYVIGMRLHFLLAGVLAGAKVSGFSYNLKVAGALEKLDLYYNDGSNPRLAFQNAHHAKNIEEAKTLAKKAFTLLKQD